MIRLTFDPSFSKLNTCFLLEDGFTLRCRISEVCSPERIVDVPLRRRYHVRGRVFISAIDSDRNRWMTESAVIHPDMARTQLLVEGVPPDVVRIIGLLENVKEPTK